MERSSSVTVYSAAILAAGLWGFLGFFTRNLDDEGFTPFEVTFLRMAICTAAIFAAICLKDRASLKIRKKDLWIFIVMGIFKILVDLLIYLAQIRIDLALATVLQFTCPYFVLLFSVILFGEKITWGKMVSIVIAFIGCILVTGMLDGEIGYDVVGCALALASGISYAAYIVGTKLFLDRGYSENCTLFYIFLFGTLIMVPLSDPSDMFTHVDGLEPVLNLLAMGILMTLAPYYLVAYALKKGNAVKVNLLGLLEVVFATAVGFFLFSEELGIVNIIGIILAPASIAIMYVPHLFHR